MKLSCMELDPKINCHFEAHGATAEDVATKMMGHLKSSHPDKVKEIKMSDSDIMSMLESKAHN